VKAICGGFTKLNVAASLPAMILGDAMRYAVYGLVDRFGFAAAMPK